MARKVQTEQHKVRHWKHCFIIESIVLSLKALLYQLKCLSAQV